MRLGRRTHGRRGVRPIVDSGEGQKELVDSASVLLDAFSRVREASIEVLDGLSAEELAFRADTEANSIAWLVWHLTRVQDDHVCRGCRPRAGLGRRRLGRAVRPRARCPGHRLRPQPRPGGRGQGQRADLLSGYHDAVFESTAEYLNGLSGDDLDRVVDRRWDPPGDLGVRLVSVVADDLQHVGQAAFVRGLCHEPAT